MRKGGIFWGTIIILAGVLLLVDNFIPNFHFWTFFWPLVLIALGVWFLAGPMLFRHNDLEMQSYSLPLQGAQTAEVRLNHGAGRLSIGPGENPDELLSGAFYGGVDAKSNLMGSTLTAKLEPVHDSMFMFPWGYHSEGYTWNVLLNRNVPMTLRMSTGADETSANLADLHITELKLETGASKTDIILPANAGYTKVKIEAGAAAVNLRIPAGVAARIFVKSGLSGITVDQARFNRIGENYESPDYATAANKMEINVETGVGSVDIR
jgi:hypothetical protein